MAVQFKFISPVLTQFLCSVCSLTRPVFGHFRDYIARTKKQHNIVTLSMTVELASFQHGDGVFHIKALAFACPRTRSAGSHVFDSTRIVPDSAAVLRGLLTKWPIMAFAPFARLTAHLYWCGSTNLYSRHSAWLDGAGKRRSCQNHPVDQRSPKGPSSQTSWRTSISWGSAPTYRTQRTFSLLHLHSSVQQPTPGWSARKRLDLPAGRARAEQGLA